LTIPRIAGNYRSTGSVLSDNPGSDLNDNQQLHGRQAHVVVPMDGWLVGSFPRSLLTTDQSVLDVLAASRQLGDTAQASSGIRLPIALLVPAKLFGTLTAQERDLADHTARLVSTADLARQSPTGRPAVPASGNVVARKLIDDLATILAADGTIDRDYPGH
jgi:hypothetical protein